MTLCRLRRQNNANSLLFLLRPVTVICCGCFSAWTVAGTWTDEGVRLCAATGRSPPVIRGVVDTGAVSTGREVSQPATLVIPGWPAPCSGQLPTGCVPAM